MRFYFCSHCDTGADEIQVGSHRKCPFCSRSLKLTSTEIVAFNNRRRERGEDRLGAFVVTGQLLEACQDSAEEDGSIHVDTLIDIAHDMENLDLQEFLLTVGLFTDYIFLED